MDSNPNPIPINGDSREDSRRHGRIRGGGIECNLGEIINISASGLKLRSPNKKRYLERGQQVTLSLRHDTREVTLTATVQWANGVGSGATEAGLTWGELDDASGETLREIIRAAVSESMLPKRAGR